MEGIIKDYDSYRGCKAIFPIMDPMESLSKLAPLIEEQNETIRETGADGAPAVTVSLVETPASHRLQIS